MKLETRKYLDRIAAVNGYLDARTAFLATWPKIATFRTALNAAEAAIIANSTAQGSQSGSGNAQVGLKQTPLEALTDDLRAMARTARQIDAEIPGTSASFMLPTSKAELAIIGAARVFLLNATPAALQNEFVGYGLPADFLADLQNDIALYENLAATQTGAEQASSLALKNLDTAIGQSSAAIDQLDALIRNIYLKNPIETAAWKEAKRLRDSRAHRVAPTPIAAAK